MDNYIVTSAGKGKIAIVTPDGTKHDFDFNNDGYVGLMEAFLKLTHARAAQEGFREAGRILGVNKEEQVTA